MPYIDTYRRRLERRHYVNDATSDTHWYDINKRKYDRFLAKYGEDFCIVLVCSHPPCGFDDAYVLPVREFKSLFTPDYLKVEPHSTIQTSSLWMGHIIDNRISVECTGKEHRYKSVAEYHNAYNLLQDAPTYVREESEYV